MASKNILTAHTVASASYWEHAQSHIELRAKFKSKVHPIAWQEIQTSVRFTKQNVWTRTHLPQPFTTIESQVLG